MTLARTHSIALAGVQGHVVEIEADIENGPVGLQLIGLPDTALREARDRIRSAVINSGHDWPMRRITVGLSPASLPKRGSGFDVATQVPCLTARTPLKVESVRVNSLRAAACCASRPIRDAVRQVSKPVAPSRPRYLRGIGPLCETGTQHPDRRILAPRART